VFDQAVVPYWVTDVDEVIVSRVKDMKMYTDQLGTSFEAGTYDSKKNVLIDSCQFKNVHTPTSVADSGCSMLSTVNI